MGTGHDDFFRLSGEVPLANDRVSGLLLHPTSLSGGVGVGDFGDGAYRFVDFLKAAGQRRWQILPLGHPGHGNSPYTCLSTHAGNPLLISPGKLVEDGFLHPDDLVQVEEMPGNQVDFEAAFHAKTALLSRAFEQFQKSPPKAAEGFDRFCARQQDWLDDYALFVALKSHYNGAPWHQWEQPVRERRPEVLDQWRNRLAGQIERVRHDQFLFHEQWQSVRRYAARNKVAIIGDLPIFLPHDSVDVWCRPELFKLDKTGRPTVVAGVPPDYFSDTGQLWGNPVYHWQAHEKEGFAWWVARIRTGMSQADILRLDHFRGFAAGWEVPTGAPDATSGKWVTGPGTALFAAVSDALGPMDKLPLIAEDLGIITDDVIALREAVGFPGMAVLQFAFDSGSENTHLPHHHRPNQVVYTGTHDNDTTVGWYTRLDATVRHAVRDYLKTDGHQIHWDLIRAALASVAETAIIPVQDILGLGSVARMNCPGKADGSWGWRLLPDQLDERLADTLKEVTVRYGR